MFTDAAHCQLRVQYPKDAQNQTCQNLNGSTILRGAMLVHVRGATVHMSATVQYFGSSYTLICFSKYTVKLNYLGKRLLFYFFLCHTHVWKLLHFPKSVEAAKCHLIFGHVLLYKIMYICMLYLIFAID